MMTSSIDIPNCAANPVAGSLSETDFVVLGGSPNVQLSEGDILDELGLDVQVNSLGIQSLSMKSDIERLTKDNEQLKSTLLGTNDSLKKHLHLCTMWREQMKKCHERDAMMLEEARQCTLKHKEENETLKTCLESTQKKLEDVILHKFNLEKIKTDLSHEVERMQGELAECREKLEEAGQKAEEISFVHIEEPENKATIDRLNAELAEVQQLLAAAATAEGNPTIRKLEEDKSDLEKKLDNATQEQLESLALRAQLTMGVSEKEMEIVKLRQDYDDLLRQISLDKASFDEQREKKIQDLKERLGELEKVDEQNKQLAAQLEKSTKEKSDALEKLSASNCQIDNLNERIRILSEEKGRAEAKCQEALLERLSLREQVAAADLLQNDQASQIEAFKEALRMEQYLRQKLETDYTNVLQTWENFERNQAVVVPGGEGQQSQVDQAALDVANAERLRLENEVRRLENDVRMLRETVLELQTTNVKLAKHRQVSRTNHREQAERNASASGESEKKCPLCNLEFTDQIALIQHAGICENESGAL